MNAKIQLIKLGNNGEDVLDTVYSNTRKDGEVAEKITDLFFLFPYRNIGKFTKCYIQMELYFSIGEPIKTLLPFMWDKGANGSINLFFFNNFFMHKVNNAVIDCLNRHFIEWMVRQELEKINITQF